MPPSSPRTYVPFWRYSCLLATNVSYLSIVAFALGGVGYGAIMLTIHREAGVEANFEFSAWLLVGLVAAVAALIYISIPSLRKELLTRPSRFAVPVPDNDHLARVYRQGQWWLGVRLPHTLKPLPLRTRIMSGGFSVVIIGLLIWLAVAVALPPDGWAFVGMVGAFATYQLLVSLPKAHLVFRRFVGGRDVGDPPV